MNFQDLSKRALYTITSMLILAALLVFAYCSFVKWAIVVLTMVIGAVAMWEFIKLKKTHTEKGYLELLIGATASVIFSFFLSTLTVKFTLLPILVLYLTSVILFAYHFNQIKGSTQGIAQGFLGLFYIAVPLGLILKILYFNCFETSCIGRIWLIYLLVVTKSTDIGAYFGGRLFGNKKLAVHVSPGKTIVGAVSGFVAAVFFSLLFYGVSYLFPFYHLRLIDSLWLGAVMGILAQVGDLAESLLKRDAKVKDSNKLPGLGGVLDMVDSLLFTAPVIFFFLYFL